MDPSQISSKTLLGKVIRLPFKLLPAHAVVPIVRGPARGKRWISDSSAHGFWLGYWELGNQRRFAAHLRPGDVVYDIGAHAGLYTLISSDRVGPEGHVYAFEPFPSNLDHLRRHIALNHLRNCTVVAAAVSNCSSRCRFDPSTHDAAGHLSDSGSVEVETVSLDEFLYGRGDIRPPNVMKINAEGAEADILMGARRTIAEHFPLIFLSVHSQEIDRKCWNFLDSAGYKLERLSADKIWAERPSQRAVDLVLPLSVS